MADTPELLSKYQLVQIAQIKPSPTSVLPHKGEEVQFELISGERRLRAAKLLGWTTIEAKVIQTVSEAEAAAKGFDELSKLDPDYWTQVKIGQIAGKKQSEISETLRLPTALNMAAASSGYAITTGTRNKY